MKVTANIEFYIQPNINLVWVQNTHFFQMWVSQKPPTPTQLLLDEVNLYVHWQNEGGNHERESHKTPKTVSFKSAMEKHPWGWICSIVAATMVVKTGTEGSWRERKVDSKRQYWSSRYVKGWLCSFKEKRRGNSKF